MNERRQDFELLQRFMREGEQSAFADVVRRHLDLVFATALRKVEDPGAAQEVAQNVFAALARKAWRFAPDDSIPAWLHKAALLESKFWLRGELGRRRREEAAAELGTTMKTSENQPAFAALVPLLDEALLSLREKDRTALLLRFYESQSLREVGAAAGVSEDAARMRVQSALEKLAEFFKRRGFKTATVAAAAAALQHTATTASATMASAIVGVVLKTAPPALAGLGLLLARLMSLTRMQTAAVCVTLAAVPAAWQLNERHTAGEEVTRHQSQLLAAQNEHTGLQLELERLRATTGRLEQSLAQANQAAARATESEQAFGNWKQRIRAPLLAADYRWDDDSPFVRIPKAILPKLSEWSDAIPFSPLGVEPYARELMGLTPSERKAVETVIQRGVAGADAAVQETNQPVSGRVIAARRFVLSGMVGDAKASQDQVLAEIRNILGEERWPMVEVTLSEKRGGGVVNYNLRHRMFSQEYAKAVTVTIAPGSEDSLYVLCSFSIGGMSGTVGAELSSFLPEGDPNRTKGADGFLSDGSVSLAIRQRIVAWLGKEATARFVRKEQP